MSEITLVNLISWIITIILFSISLLYTWFSKRIRGPDFIVPEVYLENLVKIIRKDHSVRFDIRIMTLIQNIGDRAGYLRIESAKTVMIIDNRKFAGYYYRTGGTKRNLLVKSHPDAFADNPSPLVMKVGDKDINFQQKAFDFIFPDDIHELSKELYLILEGKQSSNRDEMKPFKKKLMVEIGSFKEIEQPFDE